MNDDQAQRELLTIVVRWLDGELPTKDFPTVYWAARDRLLRSNHSAFTGAFGEAMSVVDLASDAYDSVLHSIGEPEMRHEIVAAIDRLRRQSPALFEDGPTRS